MNLKLRAKLSAAFGIILIFFLANIIFGIASLGISEKNITYVKDFAYKQLQYSKTISTSVIQVQQFLSDASATKNAHSIDEADKYKKTFKDSIKEFQKLNPEMENDISKIDKDFDEFYETGVDMANEYIGKGYEAGNVLMDKFDPMAINLTEEIDKLNSISENAMAENLDKIHSTMKMNIKVSAAFGIISILIAIAIILIFARSITIPVNNMLYMLNDLEKGAGDLTKRIGIKSKDEIGEVSNSFNNFMESLAAMVSKIKGNSKLVTKNSDELSQICGKSTKSIMEINSAMSKLNSESQNISNSISQVTANIESIAESSQVAANNAQEICIMADNINIIARESGQYASDTMLEMSKIENISVNTMQISEKLGSKAEEIEKITETIKAITNQTNLLALNASIEAARAGEQGKGFSVVAEEIRKLAEDNNKSAKMIEDLVKGIHEMIKDTIKSTAEVGITIKQGSSMVENVFNQLKRIIEDIDNINGNIQNVAANSEEQSAATQELAAAIETINSNNKIITNEIKGMFDGIQSQSDINSILNNMETELNTSAKQLNILVEKFITE